MSKNKIVWISVITVSVLAVIGLCIILFNSDEKVKTIEEILEDDVISTYIDITAVTLPNELIPYDEVDLRKVIFKPELGTTNLDEGIKQFFVKQDQYVLEIIDELVSKENTNTLANTIVECEVEDDILYLNVKYRITYPTNKVREYTNTINIRVGTEENSFDAKSLGNEELIELLNNGTSLELSNQIFDTIKETWDYTNLRDLEYGIFCSDLHFEILRNAYVNRIWDKFNTLTISKHNGKLYFEYFANDTFDLLNVESKSKTSYGNYTRLYFKDANKYKVPEIKTYDYENDKFVINDSYLSKIYDMNSKHFVADEYKVLDFLGEEEVDLNDYSLEDECACINEDFIDAMRLTRITFKGLPKDTFRDFVYNQEKTFRQIFIALAEDSSATKHSIEGMYIKVDEDGPYDTKIYANIYKDVLSVYSLNIIPDANGDIETVNNLLINVRDGNKLSNTEMFALLEFNKDDVVEQIADMICAQRDDYDKESIKMSIVTHFENMIFYIRDEKVFLTYNLTDMFSLLNTEVNKGEAFSYETMEILKR